MINSPEFQKEIDARLAQERERRERTMKSDIEREKSRILEDFRRKEEEEKRSKQKLEDILAENERKVRLEQQRQAEEQAKADELRLMELQKLQVAREEERRKKALEEKEEPGSSNQPLPRQRLAFKMKTSSLF
ncbi:hypothetical protein TGPRC2_271178 [Toxoplasma gondii TgCatPRC2]|uniref:Uncharacterized protein n=14 Tax=Toxoplasma gondii TaxID=5811 RepID=A0A125YHH3_TOXGV|nr:hypothetical protein TGME49_271178 [Toxoplasma gondii ME49]EPR64666.1 hypothetical protein TGGT1_271178 [Toxoplasma gondii GT1]ESS36175.1 hypothetical protein TGVEG_271178 [Toxoplasma gondii VEG]KAF4642212.1 hypothetical protein TGRH88_080250 [Toxoplasma gondii]KFG43503.1 hypothetical protein TGDOM2_271178 [Toxoplasma gondii GAB2-2007-GAL-DOM2]KFG52023.1 hypothetical protein TGP89_271178 [Toxoplasma gondii p89]KFG54282.1 hypothetical protein TGFOU_271178 [Toxoplasma gondii FOU]KFG61702.1 |eukprot:XP_018636645.1 hypothetical protein TGME49_271178 [Toxoplasma gondii ME49]